MLHQEKQEGGKIIFHVFVPCHIYPCLSGSIITDNTIDLTENSPPYDKMRSYLGKVNNEILEQVKIFVQGINKFYIRIANGASEKRDDKIGTMNKTPEDKAIFNELKNNYENIS